MKRAALVATGLLVAGASAAPARAASVGREHVQHARQGAVRAEYRYRFEKHQARGRLRIWSHGRRIVDMRADQYASGVGRVVSVRQLDGTGPPEVLLNVYSGGAHCCWDTLIFTGRHRVRQHWGHGLPKLRDADGNGKPEFHGLDTRFAYAFASFAQSRFPAQVTSYSGNALHDVTASYPTEVKADMARQYAEYRAAVGARDRGLVRGALAAYAADGFSLGQGDAAMAVVQAAADAGEAGTATSRDDPFWEPGYVAKLRTLLRELGYDKTG